MIPGSMKVFASRITLATAGVLVSVSMASTRPGTVGARDELLADDSAKRFADHDANLFLLIDRENIEKAIECARGVAGMKRAEHKMTRFRRGDGERDRFEVAHFADHDDIGIFTQRAAQVPHRTSACACALHAA